MEVELDLDLNCSAADRTAATFGKLLDWHLRRGTRPRGRPEAIGETWENESFGSAGIGKDERTVRNWRAGRTVPSDQDLIRIEKALFGENSAYDDWRVELRTAHRRDNRTSPKQSVSQKVGLSISVPANSSPPRKPRNLPYASIGTLLKGREEFLHQLHDDLKLDVARQATQIVSRSIYGLGGIGKTRLCIEYAIRYEKEYLGILYISAENERQIDAEFSELVTKQVLDIPEALDASVQTKSRLALGWMEEHPGWLLILDNVDSSSAASAVEEFIARLRGGSIIIAGRFANFSAATKKRELETLSLDAAVEFLMDRTADDRDKLPNDLDCSRELAVEISGLALGLEQSAAYVATQRISFQKYLIVWKQNREMALNWFDKNLMSYNRDVGLAATWLTTLDRLTEPARFILGCLSYFAPDPIPTYIFDVSDNEIALDLRKYSAEFYAYSLISRDNSGSEIFSVPSFNMHRLFRYFVNSRISPHEKSRMIDTAMRWVRDILESLIREVHNHPSLYLVMKHGLALAMVGHAAETKIMTAVLYNRIGVIHKIMGDYVQAKDAAAVALREAERCLDETDPELAVYLNAAANAQLDLDETAGAENLLTRAQALLNPHRDSNTVLLASVLNGLAGLLRGDGRLNERELLFREVVSLYEDAGEKGAGYLAAALRNLGDSLLKQNKAEAEPVLRRAFDIAKQRLQYPELASICQTIGLQYGRIGAKDEGEQQFRQALELLEYFYGTEHIEVARCLFIMGIELFGWDKHSEAIEIIRRALVISEKKLGTDFPETVKIRVKLAEFIHDSTKFKPGLSTTCRSMLVVEMIYGADHAESAHYRNVLESFYGDFITNTDIDTWAYQAAYIPLSLFGVDHPTLQEFEEYLTQLATILLPPLCHPLAVNIFARACPLAATIQTQAALKKHLIVLRQFWEATKWTLDPIEL